MCVCVCVACVKKKASHRSVWLLSILSSTWQITGCLQQAVRIHSTAEHTPVHCVGIWAHLIAHRFPFSPPHCARRPSNALQPRPSRLIGSILSSQLHFFFPLLLIHMIYLSEFGAWNPRHWGSSCLSRLVFGSVASMCFSCSSVLGISHTHLHTHTLWVVLHRGGYCQSSNDVKRMCHFSRLESPFHLSAASHRRALAFTPQVAVRASAMLLSCETDICSLAAHDSSSLFAVTLSAYLWG